jgi:hypothetical protein
MLRYVLDRHELVANFVARTKRASGFSPHAGFTDRKLRSIGIVDGDNEMIAGIVYFNHMPAPIDTIEMSIEALPGQRRWLTRTTLALMYRYPFLQCGCQMLITKTSARSEHVLRMLAAMNFSLILVPRSGGRDEDGVIATLTVEDWVAGKFCQAYGHHLPEQMERAA